MQGATVEGATEPARRQAMWWRWPLLVVLVVITLGCVAAFFAMLVRQEGPTHPLDAALALHPLLWTVPGLVVLRRAAWHPVGWMLVAIGIGFALSFDLGDFRVWETVLTVPPAWGAWITDGWGNSVSFTFTVTLLAVFPDGLAGQSRRERRWARIRITACFAALLASALTMRVGGFEGNTFPDTYRNPTGLGFIPNAIGDWVFVVLIVSMAAAPYSLWRRSRRADEARHRQYTWVLFPFTGLIILLVLAIPLSTVIGEVVWYPVIAAYFVLPVAFSMGMVRHRWFDIDRIVSRTVSYAAVALVIALVYVIPVVVLPEVLGLSSDLAVALATLAVAAAFTPLRRRVQSVVDRRFDRERYDAERVVDAFSGRLQTAVDLGRVTDELGGVVTAALRPVVVSVWFSEGAGR